MNLYYWIKLNIIFSGTFLSSNNTKVKILFQLPTNDPGFSIFATTFGFLHQNSTTSLWIAFMDSEPRRRMGHLQLNANKMVSLPSKNRKAQMLIP